MSNITRLNYQDKEIILIGTAHVSADSISEVTEVITAESPDTICIELDQSRYDSLTNPTHWQQLDIKEIIKEKRVAYLLVNIILASFQNRLADQSGISSGGEMLEGIRLATELSTNLVLADRDIKTTFMRVYRSLSFWEKIKMLSSLITSIFDKTEISPEEIERLKEQDMLNQALDEISKEFPNIKKTLVDERDQYLTYKIQNAPGTKVVAILGAAHTIGIKKLMEQAQSLEGLDDIPPALKIGKIIAWTIPLFILALIIASFVLSPKLGFNQLIVWALWHGSASALACLLLGAHPLTILSAIVLSPFTAMSPLVGVGVFAALVEAMIRKPKVKDFESMAQDAQTLKGFFRNKVIRILLIFIVTNVFNGLATYISGFNIFKSLLKNI